MTVSSEMLIAIIGGSFALGGIIVGTGLTSLHSFIAYRQKRADDLLASADREHAIFHGAFAVCNFLAERLNDWDESRNIYALSRAVVAQPYLANLIEKSPHDSERLMVSLIDLGIRLDAMLFASGFSIGSGSEQPSDADLTEVAAAIDELSRAVEVVQLLLDGELPMMSDEELADLLKLSDEGTGT